MLIELKNAPPPEPKLIEKPVQSISKPKRIEKKEKTFLPSRVSRGIHDQGFRKIVKIVYDRFGEFIERQEMKPETVKAVLIETGFISAEEKNPEFIARQQLFCDRLSRCLDFFPFEDKFRGMLQILYFFDSNLEFKEDHFRTELCDATLQDEEFSNKFEEFKTHLIADGSSFREMFFSFKNFFLKSYHAKKKSIPRAPIRNSSTSSKRNSHPPVLSLEKRPRVSRMDERSNEYFSNLKSKDEKELRFRPNIRPSKVHVDRASIFDRTQEYFDRKASNEKLGEINRLKRQSQEIQKCSFKPQINTEIRAKLDEDGLYAPGYQEAVVRVNKARQERKITELLNQRGNMSHDLFLRHIQNQQIINYEIEDNAQEPSQLKYQYISEVIPDNFERDNDIVDNFKQSSEGLIIPAKNFRTPIAFCEEVEDQILSSHQSNHESNNVFSKNQSHNNLSEQQRPYIEPLDLSNSMFPTNIQIKAEPKDDPSAFIQKDKLHSIESGKKALSESKVESELENDHLYEQKNNKEHEQYNGEEAVEGLNSSEAYLLNLEIEMGDRVEFLRIDTVEEIQERIEEFASKFGLDDAKKEYLETAILREIERNEEQDD